MTLNKERGDLNFYVDSGVTTHITSNPTKMSQVVPYKGNGVIFVRNEEPLRISIFFFLITVDVRANLRTPCLIPWGPEVNVQVNL